MNPVNQKEIDDKMRELDGTPNKGKLGANAILAVSMAVCSVGGLSFACHVMASPSIDKPEKMWGGASTSKAAYVYQVDRHRGLIPMTTLAHPLHFLTVHSHHLCRLVLLRRVCPCTSTLLTWLATPRW